MTSDTSRFVADDSQQYSTEDTVLGAAFGGNGEYRHRRDGWPEPLYTDGKHYGWDHEKGELTGAAFRSAWSILGRNHAPFLLFDLYYLGGLDITTHPEVVADAWSGAEFPSRALTRAMWVELFNVAGYTSAGQPAEPPEQVTVWRGCTPGRRHGMSWTADRDKAQWFADRPGYASRGRVYVHRASGYELLAYISDRNESEYVIDPQYLAGGVVHPA